MRFVRFIRAASSDDPTRLSITEGSIFQSLVYFFFPVLTGTFFQQLYNTVDALVVGHFVGKEALAAVGGGAAVFVNLIVGFFVGLTSGGGVLISQFYGADNKRDISRAVHTSFALSFIGGLFMTGLGMFLSKPVLIITKTPDETFILALNYLLIYFCSMVPMFVYNTGAAIFRACGDSFTPLLILVASCFLNILLDLLFVIVFKGGVRGAALATFVCQAVSAAAVLVLLMKTKKSIRFSFKKLSFTPHILKEIVRIGFPAGIQSSLYTVSNLIIQTNINTFGTDEVAAWAAYGKLDAVFWMLISALGISVTTFAGQNYGAKKYARVKKGMYESLLIAAMITIVLSFFFLLTGKTLFFIFTKDSAVIDLGYKMLTFMVPFWMIYISIEIISGTIRGCGQSFIPMMITVFGVCGLRLLWLFIAVPHSYTLKTVLLVYPITWLATSVAFWIYYATGKWLPAQKNYR